MALIGRGRAVDTFAAMHGADNPQVNLPKKLPVYIVYFTTYVDDGQLFFGNDLSGRPSPCRSFA